jgi:acyl-homoserine lactone acylase PvdQ
MDAWADGLNYYLATHPEVRPRVLTRVEPWSGGWSLQGGWGQAIGWRGVDGDE